jgi:type VI protein secretion system component Hcp
MISRNVGGPSREGSESKTTDLVGTKGLDENSPKLAEATAKGLRIDSARFAFVKIGEKGDVQEFHTIEFTDGFISNISISAEIESLTFTFDTAK